MLGVIHLVIKEVTYVKRISVLAAVMYMAGCTSGISLVVNSSAMTKHLQMVSAGHTGCLPEDNQLSNITASPDGSGLWNATCRGKIYLCSAVGSAGSNAESYSCAPLAK